MRAYRAARSRSATDIWDEKTTTILVANTMLAQIPTRVSDSRGCEICAHG